MSEHTQENEPIEREREELRDLDVPEVQADAVTAGKSGEGGLRYIKFTLKGGAGHELEVEAHEHARQAGAPSIGLGHAAEAGVLEHAERADLGRRAVDARAARVDRVGLERRRALLARVRDHAVEERAPQTAPPVAEADREAEDRPHREVVDDRDRPRPDEALHRLPEAELAPAGRLPGHVREHPGRRVPLHLCAKNGSALLEARVGVVARRHPPVPAGTRLASATAENGDRVVEALARRGTTVTVSTSAG
jgi:hypothetical protein